MAAAHNLRSAPVTSRIYRIKTSLKPYKPSQAQFAYRYKKYRYKKMPMRKIFVKQEYKDRRTA